MEIIEKDFVVGGVKLGTFSAYKNIEREFIPSVRGEYVIPAPAFYERGSSQFSLVARYEPGEKIGFPLGGYEVKDSTGGIFNYDLDQVIISPKTPKQKFVIERMKKTEESADSAQEDKKVMVFIENKVPGKRGRPALSAEEKERRENEKQERAARSNGKRGRPKGTGKEKPTVAAETEPKVPGRRGRPALSEEEKAKREAEKAKRFKISGGKRGRPAKKPKLDY